MIKLINADGTEQVLRNTEADLTWCQKTVGGYIQIVQVGSGQLICDEEGLLKGKEVNMMASAMYRGELRRRNVNPSGEGIVGDAIYLTGEDLLS